jgi:hypothetical protein
MLSAYVRWTYLNASQELFLGHREERRAGRDLAVPTCRAAHRCDAAGSAGSQRLPYPAGSWAQVFRQHARLG